MNFGNRFQFNECWVPATPEKPPSSGRSNPIVENRQVNYLGMNYWPHTESYDLFPDPNSVAGRVPGRFTADQNPRQSHLPGTEWNDGSLMQLLLQGDSGLLTGAFMPDLQRQPSNFHGDCSFDGFGSSLSVASVVNNGHCQRGISFSSVNHGLASEQFDNGTSLHQTDNFSRSSMINYNLNVSPTMESEPLTSANTAQFIPVTPYKDLRTTEKHHSALSSSGHSENLVQKSTETQQHCSEVLQNIVDLSSSTLVSTPMKENKDSDKKTDLGIDLNETPQQKTPKRRKHRPKVVVEGKPKRIPKNTVPENTEPKAKRKYVRKNVLKDLPAQEVVGDTIKDPTEPNSETAQKSCKRVLVFDLEDENPSGLGTILSVPMENPKRLSRENQMEGKTNGGFVALLNSQEARRSLVSENDVQVLNSCAVSRPETNNNSEPENGIQGKGNGKFNEMDLEKVKKLMQSVLQPIPKTPFKLHEQRGSKRDHSLYTTNYAASMVERNEHNVHIGIPQIGKKQKTSDEYRDEQRNMLLLDQFSLNSSPNADATLNSHSRCRLSEAEKNERILFTGDLFVPSVASTSRHHSTVQIVQSNHNSSSGETKSTEIPNPLESNSPILQMSNTKPKMNKKMGAPQRKTDLSEQAPKQRGRKTKPTYRSLIDEIIDRIQILDLNGNGNGLHKRDGNALVLYKAEVALVPYEDELTKQRKLRPKVDLDPESNRIWNLLMGKDEAEEQNDEKKEKWWEEERKVFRGRVDSFIARMHLVQGDRRFSRWKGSVVDSVIGVFLTQNVSDHLSSSAFMSMAARFPLKSSSSSNTDEETTNIIDLESPILSQESFDSSITQVAAFSGSNSETEDPSNGLVYRDCTVVNENSQLKLDCGNNYMLPFGGNNVSTDSTRSGQWWLEAFSEENISSWKSPTDKPVVAVDFTSVVDLQTPRLEPNLKVQISASSNQSSVIENTKTSKARKGNPESEIDWDGLRKQLEANGTRKERREDATDSLDYEAMRNADVSEISDAIKERGMSNVLAGRMKEFLNRVVKDHGSIDLEWLRDVAPDKAKDYLLSIRGLGLKSVECVRLLTLHHLAFPVDTNVGRIAVRLGWVPLRPLPESLQLHLLELYPILESIQKYLWPRLCKLDQRTLYELHYQMITFGKVFCTKSKPNCNACPMRGECRHFASAFASARLTLPGPEERHIVSSVVPQTADKNPHPSVVIHPIEALPAPHDNSIIQNFGSKNGNCEPIIEEPATPEQEHTDILESDIEDAFYEDPDEIPTIKLDMGEFRESLQSYMKNNMEIQEADVSKALVALTPDVASLPIPKLKNVNRLRTEHQVYELPDSHPLLERLERREPDDPSPYLLAIWTPGETANSIQPPEKSCGSEPDKLCNDTTCFSCNSVREANSQTVRGTILIPCRTAMRGSFPLNGTYFQVNEVFADHESSLSPIDVPRGWIWNLPRRTVYFGTSVSSIFKGLTTEGIQYCFWKGFVCVRGFDMETRAPRPLKARLHFPASKLTKNKQDERR